MSQMAFDTLQASEALETAGMSREQARAISLIVRRSHEVADVATKADIAEVKRDIADVRKDMDTLRKSMLSLPISVKIWILSLLMSVKIWILSLPISVKIWITN